MKKKLEDKKGFLYARTDFGPPPPDYVPGYGRGAVGFITRSDIGEAIGNKQLPPTEDENLNEAVYDNWNGYGAPLFNNCEYDDDDKEADRSYQKIEDRMDQRRGQRRENKLKTELEKISKEKPSIAQQFSDLKRDLGQMSQDQWMEIPDAMENTKKKVKRDTGFATVSDRFIDSARKSMETANSISVEEGGMTPLTNLNVLGQTRELKLAQRLDQQQDSVSGTTTVDKKGFLTELSSTYNNQNIEEVGDFEKARNIMKSVINSNPQNPDGWIAAARIEESNGKVQYARNILRQAIKHCQDSDDLWLETARLEPPENSKATLARAVQILPKSFKIWQMAAHQESNVTTKKKILKRALEHIPNNPKLWKTLIEQEESDEEARELLRTAVECVPGNTEMWLALAKLEPYQEARKVLSRASRALPTEHSIWIAAAKLEEAQSSESINIQNLIQNGLNHLKKNGYVLNRDEWIEEAECCERSGNPLVCKAVAKTVCFEGLLEGNKLNHILDDIQQLAEKKSFMTCRAIYYQAMHVLTDNKPVIYKAIDIEIENLKQEEEFYLTTLIEQAVKKHPTDENIWIKCCKSVWQMKDECSKLIEQSLENLPQSDNIIINASKFEQQQGNIEKARELLYKTHTEMNMNVRSYKNLLKFELRHGSVEKAFELAQQALKLFMKEEKIVTLCAHVSNKHQGLEAARRIFKQGLDNNRESVLLWSQSIELEMRNQNFTRARPLLEKARLLIPRASQILQLAVVLEVECKNRKNAQFLLSKAIKELPKDGKLWALKIELEPRQHQTKAINLAIQSCEKDPYIYLAGAKLFWKDRKYEKARKWIELSIKQDPFCADSWAYLYYLEETLEKLEKAKGVANKMENMFLKKGVLWNSVRKTELGWSLPFSEMLKVVCSKIQKQLAKFD